MGLTVGKINDSLCCGHTAISLCVEIQPLVDPEAVPLTSILYSPILFPGPKTPELCCEDLSACEGRVTHRNRMPQAPLLREVGHAFSFVNTLFIVAESVYLKHPGDRTWKQRGTTCHTFLR